MFRFRNLEELDDILDNLDNKIIQKYENLYTIIWYLYENIY